MPAKSKSQQRLMGMAWAVRKGELSKNEVDSDVKKLASSNMKDKDMKAFAKTKHKNLPDYIKEQIVSESKTSWTQMQEYAKNWLGQEWKIGDMEMVINYVIQGFMDAIEYRLSNPQLTSREQKEAEEMEKMLIELHNIVNG